MDKDILEFSEQIKELAKKELNRIYSERFVYAFSLHLSAFFKRNKEKKYGDARIYEPTNDHNEEYRLAQTIKSLIESKFGVHVPEAEITYMAILLKSVEEERQGSVGIIVAAHGTSTASSIVGVVDSLLGSSNLCAVDMPLDVSPREILDLIIDKVKSIDRGRGVLLLVDMGSLLNLEETIMERVGINVKTIDMVSTPLTLEAVRKASVFDMGIEEIYQSLKDFRGYNNSSAAVKVVHKAIVTVCSSGKGAAVKLKEFVEKIVCDLTDEEILVVPANVRELDKVVQDMRSKRTILAVIGVKRPSEPEIPFIPLEKLIEASGEQTLRELLLNNKQIPAVDQSVVVRELCEESLKEFMTYLNPHKILGMVMRFVQELELGLGVKFDYATKVQISTHTAYALERMVIRDGLVYQGEVKKLDQRILEVVNRSCSIFVSGMNLILSDDEKYYICEMLSEVYNFIPQ
ncbi:PRD domain-containing protein [Paenibacillus polymyxa]|uniref:PRD domain-containing protein n=1 Tax=Paenibacillus polymyxa TaxID=1406 RepID=UPI0032AF7178